MCVVTFGDCKAIGVTLWVYAKECIDWEFRGNEVGRQLDTVYLGSMQTYGRLQCIFFYLRIISMAVF